MENIIEKTDIDSILKFINENFSIKSNTDKLKNIKKNTCNFRHYVLEYLCKKIIITAAPSPYIAQNGPYKKLCLLSSTPYLTSANIVSIKKPAIL